MTAPSRRGGRKKDPQLVKWVEQILALPIDASVFVPNAQPADLQFLRTPVREAGATIEIVKVNPDEIYGTPGVRLFRREGTFDQL